MTTAVFIFSNDCPSCISFKRDLYRKVKTTLRNVGVSHAELTAGDDDYDLATRVDFYPTTILTPTKTYQAYLNRQIIFDDLLLVSNIMNAVYINGCIVGTTPIYDFQQPVDYATFYYQSSVKEQQSSAQTSPTRLVLTPIRR
jgi:hypothetical protein